MDRGGTITWYLTANDADFLAAMRRARAESKLTGDAVDKNLNKGSSSATQALRTLGGDSNTTASSIRKLGADTRQTAGSFSEFDKGLNLVSGKVLNVGSSMEQSSSKANGMRGSLSELNLGANTLSNTVGKIALKGFSSDLNGASNAAAKTTETVRITGLGLEDFRKQIGQSASTFRSFQIALRGFELTSLILGATIAGGAIIELAGNIAALAGLLYTVPAAVGAFASAFATLKIATFGVGDAFKDFRKQQAGVSAGQSLAKKQADIMKNSMKQDEALTRRLTGLKQDYSDVLQELAEERMRVLNEQIQRGVDAWADITDAARGYLDVSRQLNQLTQDITDAQTAYNTAMVTYGPASQQALNAQRDLLAAQAKLADSNAELDYQYTSITDNIKDLATNLSSLQKANRNELSASSLSLKALRLDKQARGENIAEISRMIDVLDDLINVKDTKLTINPDLDGAQSALNDIKAEFPDLAVAAQQAATSTENSLNKSLLSISDQMADIGRQRIELQKELADGLKEAAEASSSSTKDPFEGLSKNAKSFVLALNEVTEQYKSLKDVVQDNFFAGLDDALRKVATTSLPMLTKGLGLVATSMNGLILEGARVVQEPFFQGAIADSLTTTATATDTLKGAVEPLAVAFTNLMDIGNPYVLMLADWIVKQSELFSAFTSSKEGQEGITDAINGGIEALKQLGTFLGATIGLLGDLFSISQDADTSIIETFTEMVNKMREYIGTEEGQNRMKSLFEATSTIIGALGDVIGGFIKGVLGIVDAYNNLDGPLKDFITNLLVFSAIATPIISYVSALAGSLGLVVGVGKEIGQALSFFTGGTLGVGLDDLTGKAGGLNDIFRLIAKNPLIAVLGILAAIFIYLGTQTTIFQDAFAALKPVFEQFFTALQPVFDVLGQLAEVLGGALATILPVIANIFGQVLAALLPIIPPILQLVMTLFPVLVTVLQAVVGIIQFLMPIITVLVQILGVVLVAAINILVGAFKIIIGVIQFVADVFVNAWKGIGDIWNGAGDFFKNLFEVIKGLFTLYINAYIAVFKFAWETIMNVWNGAVSFFTTLGKGIGDVFNKVVDAVKNAFNTAVDFVKNVPQNILNALGNLGSLLLDAGRNLIEGLVNGISNAKDLVVNKIKEIANGALNVIKNFFGIKSPSRLMAKMGGYVMEGFSIGIADMGGEVIDAAKTVADGVVDAFSGMSGTIGGMQTDFSVNGNSTLTSQFAPSVIDSTSTGGGTGINAGGVVINQTNEVHSELDMDQVNRNLAWELNKI